MPRIINSYSQEDPMAPLIEMARKRAAKPPINTYPPDSIAGSLHGLANPTPGVSPTMPDFTGKGLY